MKLQKLVGSVSILALVAGLTACTPGGEGPTSAGGGDTYKIAAFLPLSGPSELTGRQNRAAVEAAVEVINADGGVNGRQVELSVGDNEGDPATVAARVQEAITSSSPPDLIVPGVSSFNVQGGVSMLESTDIMAAAGGAGGSLETVEGYFSGSPNLDASAEATMARVSETGAKTVGFVVSDNESGLALQATYERLADEAGIDVVETQRIPINATDVTGPLSRVQAADPDALVVSIYGPTAGMVLQSRTRLGMTLPTFGDPSVAAYDIMDMVSDRDLENVLLVAPSVFVAGTEEAESEAMQTAAAEIRDRFDGAWETPLLAAVATYMSVIMWKYAVEAADSTAKMDVWEARLDLDKSEMPLYAGTAGKIFRDGSNTAYFAPEQHSYFVPAGVVDGFLTAGE